MKKIICAVAIASAFSLSAYAVAPLVLVSVATSSGATSITTAATSAVGLTLTAFALAKSILFPTQINIAPKLITNDNSFPATRFDTASQMSNSCKIWRVRAHTAKHNTAVVQTSWTFEANVACNSPSYAQSQFVQSGCSTPEALCTQYVVHWRHECISTAGCGLMPNGSFASWSGAQAFEAQKRQETESVSDGKVSINRAINGYSYSQYDSDVPSTVGGETGFPAMTTDGGLAVQVTNSADQFSVVTAKPNPLGTTYTEYTQSSPTEYTKAEIQTDVAGTIQTGSVSTQPGTLNPVPATEPSVAVNYVPVIQTDPGTDPGTNTGSTTVTNFPSDYARTGEAASAAQAVVQAIENITAGEVIVPTVEDVEMPWFGQTFDGVLPTINTSGATCPVWQFDAIGESFYIDHHCTLITEFNALFYALFTAFWVLLAFRTVLEA